MSFFKYNPNNKCSNQKTDLDGYSFASKGEAAMYGYLKLLQGAGEIEILQVQSHVYLPDSDLIPLRDRMAYVADFRIYDKKLGEEVWVEFKGFETAVWRIKRRQWKSFGPGRLRIYHMVYHRIVLKEELVSRKLKICEGECLV